MLQRLNDRKSYIAVQVLERKKGQKIAKTGVWEKEYTKKGSYSQFQEHSLCPEGQRRYDFDDQRDHLYAEGTVVPHRLSPRRENLRV